MHLLGRDENFFLFGLTEEQIVTTRDHYDPVAIISQDEELQQVMHLLESGYFNQFEPGLFDDLINSIKSPHGPWMTIADFRSFVDTQKRVEDLIAPMACLCVAHRQAIYFFTSYRYFSFFL